MTSKTVTRLQKIKARTDVGHDGRDIAWLINEVERLTDIVKRLAGPMKRAGYDCPHCHAQIVFGDSICPVTKEQHAEPTRDETTGFFTVEKCGHPLTCKCNAEEPTAMQRASNAPFGSREREAYEVELKRLRAAVAENGS